MLTGPNKIGDFPVFVGEIEGANNKKARTNMFGLWVTM